MMIKKTILYTTRVTISQNEETPADKAYRFCVCLLRTKNEAYAVLQVALKEQGMGHINDVLNEKEGDGWVNIV